jgi:dihydroorotate dehydrogenase electron transfer subunit
MMKETVFTILANEAIAGGVRRLTLRGDTSAVTTPGQFVNLRLEGLFLRRPLSVCDVTADTLTLVYKVVGDGTRALSALPAGTALDALTGLGNGFDLSRAGARPLLIGGGLGCIPLYLLCRRLVERGVRPTVVMGFRSAEDVFFTEEFAALGARVIVATADGSRGVRGFVTDAMAGLDYTYFYACGPEPMFAPVNAASRSDGEFSFEERMGCGFGACMGCTCHTVTGYKRICRDGPVLRKEEILWT